MQVLVTPCIAAKSSSSCSYTCPVYNTGVKGVKKILKKMKKKKKSTGKVCWYDN